MQLVGDFRYGGAGGDLAENLELALRQFAVQGLVRVAGDPVRENLRERRADELAAADHGADSADQLRRRGFLVEVSGRAGAQQVDRVLILRVARQHQDRQFRT